MKNRNQAQTTYSIDKPLKLNKVNLGDASSDLILVRGSDKIVKHVPASSIISTPTLQQILDTNSEARGRMIILRDDFNTEVSGFNSSSLGISNQSTSVNLSADSISFGSLEPTTGSIRGNSQIKGSITPSVFLNTFRLPNPNPLISATYTLATQEDLEKNVVSVSSSESLSLDTLNGKFPTAKMGFKVHNISSGVVNEIYEKTETGWCKYQINILNNNPNTPN